LILGATKTMKPWKLKSSSAKNAKRVCVIKVQQGNLYGEPMKLDYLGNKEYSFTPKSEGIYRVLNNIDKSAKSIKGCQLVYMIAHEGYLRRTSKITAEEIKGFSDTQIVDVSFINKLAASKNEKYSNDKQRSVKSNTIYKKEIFHSLPPIVDHDHSVVRAVEADGNSSKNDLAEKNNSPLEVHTPTEEDKGVYVDADGKKYSLKLTIVVATITFISGVAVGLMIA